MKEEEEIRINRNDARRNTKGKKIGKRRGPKKEKKSMKRGREARLFCRKEEITTTIRKKRGRNRVKEDM